MLRDRSSRTTISAPRPTRWVGSSRRYGRASAINYEHDRQRVDRAQHKAHRVRPAITRQQAKPRKRVPLRRLAQQRYHRQHKQRQDPRQRECDVHRCVASSAAPGAGEVAQLFKRQRFAGAGEKLLARSAEKPARALAQRRPVWACEQRLEVVEEDAVARGFVERAMHDAHAGGARTAVRRRVRNATQLATTRARRDRRGRRCAYWRAIIIVNSRTAAPSA